MKIEDIPEADFSLQEDAGLFNRIANVARLMKDHHWDLEIKVVRKKDQGSNYCHKALSEDTIEKIKGLIIADLRKGSSEALGRISKIPRK